MAKTGLTLNMSHEKTERNKALRVYRKENPKLTLNRIAMTFGISAPRVCQILGKRQKPSWWSRLLQRIRQYLVWGCYMAGFYGERRFRK